MPALLRARRGLVVAILALTACRRASPPRRVVVEAAPRVGVEVAVAAPPRPVDAAQIDAAADADPARNAPDAIDAGDATGSTDAPRAEPTIRHVAFASDRTAFVVMPRASEPPARLLAMMHGVCTPPSYVCGAWKSAAADFGLLVCPVGNSTCGPGGTGGPTWEEPFAAMDADLEASVTASRRQLSPRTTREGAVLVGFSRGAYMAVIFAVRHPGRWPFLILNEADVELTVPMLRAAGVRAVALIAGEWGAQLAGERRTTEALARDGYPARLWVMPKVGHAYPSNIDAIMREALDFVLAHEAPPASPVP